MRSLIYVWNFAATADFWNHPYKACDAYDLWLFLQYLMINGALIDQQSFIIKYNNKRLIVGLCMQVNGCVYTVCVYSVCVCHMSEKQICL